MQNFPVSKHFNVSENISAMLENFVVSLYPPIQKEKGVFCFPYEMFGDVVETILQNFETLRNQLETPFDKNIYIDIYKLKRLKGILVFRASKRETLKFVSTIQFFL
eukprot:TRINITY_DN13578_c1_g1_i4.p9 TRINITY_DN13578_c1_g1~~TRINITY_DN13578_c1_g1_i4.p9  ORF type:complete len:106 (-),score=10.21 TRINITY_DN13578_c1_g1_i4:1618-1935(-)